MKLSHSVFSLFIEVSKQSILQEGSVLEMLSLNEFQFKLNPEFFLKFNRHCSSMSSTSMMVIGHTAQIRDN